MGQKKSQSPPQDERQARTRSGKIGRRSNNHLLRRKFCLVAKCNHGPLHTRDGQAARQAQHRQSSPDTSKTEKQFFARVPCVLIVRDFNQVTPHPQAGRQQSPNIKETMRRRRKKCFLSPWGHPGNQAAGNQPESKVRYFFSHAFQVGPQRPRQLRQPGSMQSNAKVRSASFFSRALRVGPQRARQLRQQGTYMLCLDRCARVVLQSELVVSQPQTRQQGKTFSGVGQLAEFRSVPFMTQSTCSQASRATRQSFLFWQSASQLESLVPTRSVPNQGTPGSTTGSRDLQRAGHGGKSMQKLGATTHQPCEKAIRSIQRPVAECKKD